MGAFASANLGDVSPNIDGPHCEFSGNACDIYSSICPIGEGRCFSSGPGRDHYHSCKIIATRLSEAAFSILNISNTREITGEIEYIHQFIDMSKARGEYLNSKTRKIEKV